MEAGGQHRAKISLGRVLHVSEMYVSQRIYWLFSDE
jgi:hypothetical protein